jgi:hypothetical protein
MKVFSTLVVSSVLVLVVAMAAAAQVSERIRPLDDAARASLESGLANSSVFRRLAAEIEESDLIVHVTTSSSLMPGKAAGSTRLSSPGLRYRYVRITLASELTPDDRTAIFGHELQHACEIARSQVRDTDSMRALYQMIGQRVDQAREAYDTTAAIDAGVRVWFDLQRAHREGSRERER